MAPRYPGWVLGGQTISVVPRKTRVPAAEVLRAPRQGRAPSGPNMAQNHQKRALVPPGVQKVPLSKLIDQISLGTVAFWPCLDPHEGVKNGSKCLSPKMILDHLESPEVFLARSEASLSRFELRRVVCFTYPQCAFQTMRALQKDDNGVKCSCTKRRETHPLQLGPNT